MTYREAINLGEKVLNMADVADAKIDAWLLLEMVCKIDRSFYYLHMEDEVAEEQLSEYEIALRKRAEHVPLQYIVGEAEFMGLKFKVNSNVLIPRQDTETLVEEALKVVKPGMKVLDLCTGSGCIIVSIVHNVPEVEGTATDISKQALLVAKDSPYVGFHVREGIRILVSEVLLGLITVVFCWTVVVPIAAAVCFIILLVVRIISFVNVCNGKAKEAAIVSNFGFLK